MADKSEQLSKHDLKQQKREEKQKQQQALKHKDKGSENFRKLAIQGVIGAVALLLGYLVYSTMANAPAQDASVPVSVQQIHWHAFVSDQARHADKAFVTVCGEKNYLPMPASNQHLGSGLLHTHYVPEHWIHLEGRINVNAPPTLGEFFKNIGITFDSTHLYDKTNGDVCPNTGQPGQVKLLVNGKPSTLFEAEGVHDGDLFQVSFE